jgi:hypothetical protein
MVHAFVRPLRLTSLVFAASLAACAGSPDLPDDVAIVQQPIIKGKVSPAAQNAVVMIGIGDEGLCSGTLVAPNLVLTARHCVSQTDEGISCAPDGHALSGGRVGADHAAEDLVIYTGRRKSALHASARGAMILHDQATNLCNHDLAFVVLDREVSGMPIAPLRLTNTTRAGELVTAVGWGLNAHGALPASRMQRQDVEILDVGPSPTTPSNHFVVGESICSGDSGGPALSSRGAVIGVVSHGGNGTSHPNNAAGGCLGSSARNVYTRVSKFGALVREAFAEAHATITREAAH